MMKIKKAVYIVMTVSVVAAISGCGSESVTATRVSGDQGGVKEVLQAGMAEAESETGAAVYAEPTEDNAARQSGLNDNAPEPEETEDDATLSSTEGIDVDLTTLSSTMVYSEVYNMMYEPDKYIGKTIKMDGLFTAYHDEITGNDYFSCIIRDAAACCAQGIEFVPEDELIYPEDYPDEGADIVVEGVFDTYMEDEYKYCTLRNAVVTF